MFSKYLSDETLAKLCSTDQWVKYMLTVESALAKVQGDIGMIPDTAARQIVAGIKKTKINSTQLADSTLQNGVPVIGLLSLIKKNLPAAAKNYLHYGITSQDVMDTAQVLMIQEVVLIYENRISQILIQLNKLIEKYSDVPCMARTRGQQAIPIVFGLKLANWIQPLIRDYERLQEMKKRLFVIQLGGAAGSLNQFSSKGTRLIKALAKELNLQPSLPWHNQRDRLVEFTNWLTLVTGSLGKIAADVLILAQTEIGELTESTSGGKSSAMPHKQNPVLSEAIIALSNLNIALASAQMKTMLHGNERDATAWAVEWMSIPQMMVYTGTALQHAITISRGMRVDKLKMKDNIKITNGLVYTEIAVRVLTKYMSKAEATVIVEQACAIVNEQISLSEALSKIYSKKLNWDQLFEMALQQTIAGDIISACKQDIHKLKK